MGKSMLRLRLRKTANPSIHEKLERVKTWETIRRKWAGRYVRIWSAEHGAYWRPDGAGYTSDGLDAWVLLFEDALKQTSHCGPEKRIEFKLVDITNPIA
jgi:hypothetical protein